MRENRRGRRRLRGASERRSRHVTGRVTGLAKRTEPPNGTHSRHRSASARMQNVTGRSVCPASLCENTIYSPRRVVTSTVGRRSLKSRAILRDPRGVLSGTRWDERRHRSKEFSFSSGNYFRDYSCMSGYRAVLIRLSCLTPRSKLNLTPSMAAASRRQIARFFLLS